MTGLDGTWAGQAIGEAAEGELPAAGAGSYLSDPFAGGVRRPCGFVKTAPVRGRGARTYIVWNETLGEIQAQVMGQVQIEILKKLIVDRFGMEVEFGAGERYCIHKGDHCRNCR